MATSEEAQPPGLRARDVLNRHKASSPKFASDDVSHEETQEGITNLLGCGHEIEIHELDKSGNVTQRWLHKPNTQIIPVSLQHFYILRNASKMSL